MDWFSLITYSLPSGFLFTIITAVASRELYKAKKEQGSVDALKEVIADLSEMLKQQSDENKKLFIQCTLFRRANAKCNDCRYVSICPALAELRKQQAHAGPGRTTLHERQRHGEVGNNDEALDGAQITGIPPPEPWRASAYDGG